MNVATFRQIAHGGPDYSRTLVLRNRILRAPLGLAFSEAELEKEASDWHLAGFAPGSGEVVACLVLTPVSDRVAKMRQVAVAESHRGLGWGRALVGFSESFAWDRGIREIEMNARQSVVSFYLPLGYSVVGVPFAEVTLPHLRMRKTLRAG